MTLADAARMIANGEVSSAELSLAACERIHRLNDRFRAFITLSQEDATLRAAIADNDAANENRLPLLGVPVSVKDLYDTSTIRTTAGSKVFESRIAGRDATAVKKLDRAGAVLIGKTNLHEFAFGLTSVNPHYGTVRNPWNPEHISGGSSGGSASAVALRMGFGSLGTDTGGSIRIPASLCGIVGLKPTYGRVSLHGVVPLCWSMDHPGPMGQTVEDVAILLGVIAGYDPQDPCSRNVPVPRYQDALTGSIQGIRAGIPKAHFYDGLAPEVDSAVRAALKNLEKLGARLIPVDMPCVEVHRAVWLNIASPEAYSFHEPLLKAHAALYGSDVRGRLEAGRSLLSIDYVRAQRARTIMKRECRKLFDSVDVIVTPTTPIPAPRIDELHQPWGNGAETAAASLARFTRYFNVVGLPAISVPCGFTAGGLPIGMQIAGKAFDESTVLRVAHTYEQDAKWFERQPAI
jgi:aspartyl-tRNA(Asn)/glutamyl-tRNA(Gln) amidotransferase subunit A